MLIDLIRHGATEPPGLLLGRTDAPLSADGGRQFETQAERRDWPRIVSSPLLRAREAAESLAAKRGLTAHIDSNWAEMDFGAWDGQPVASLREDPAIAAQLGTVYKDENAAPPEGESWSALRSRVANALDDLLEAAPESDDDLPSALVVTHGGPIRTALALTCNLPFAHLWTLRIAYGTRVTLRCGRTKDDTMWGEVIEIVQP